MSYDEILRNFLGEVDKVKSQEIGKSILLHLGLSGENTACNIGENYESAAGCNILEKLSLLAYTGSKKCHCIFAEAVMNAVTRDFNTLHVVPKKSNIPENGFKKITAQNRELLFSNSGGRKLLSCLLLWNRNRDRRSGIVLFAEVAVALGSLSNDISELIENAFNVPLSETVITDWVSLTLFQQTIKSSDESINHILYTIQTDHPYNSSFLPTQRTRVYIPGASQIFITFDKKSSTQNEDVLLFYNDEDFSQIKCSYSGTQFLNIMIKDTDSIYFEFKICSCSFSNDRFGWRFDVRATFLKVQVNRNIEDLRFDLVSSSKGINLIRSYLNSPSDITSRFIALTLANLSMSPQCKEIISKQYGIDFFLNLPKDTFTMRTNAIFIESLLQEKKNRVSALSHHDIGSRLLTELTAMTRVDDVECRIRAVTSLAHLASESENIPILLKHKCLETLVDVTQSSDRKASRAAWRGLKYLSTDKERLLVYGLGTRGDMPKYRGPILEYDMLLSESNTLDLSTLKIGIPINREGIECINKVLSTYHSGNIINKVYIEVKITKGVNGRIGIVPAQDTWTCLKTHGMMIGDDALSWGIDGQRNKVFNNNETIKPSNGIKIPKPFWKEGSTIGLLVNPIDKVLEISMDGGVSFFPFSLSTTTDENYTESSLDWSTGVVFAATCLSQGLSFKIGQDTLNCPPGSVSLLDYALLNHLTIPARPLIFDRILAQFVTISEDLCADLYFDYANVDKENKLISEGELSLRNVMRLLFVGSLDYMKTSSERDMNIFTRSFIVERAHPIGIISSAFERTFRCPGASLLAIDFDRVNLGRSNYNCLLFKWKGTDCTIKEEKVTNQSAKINNYRLYLHCGENEIHFSVSLEPGDVDGWGYRFKISPMFADDGLVDEELRKRPTMIEESEFPYKNNTRVVRTLTLPGAETILITFDELSKTQYIDYVQFFSDSNLRNPVGAQKFSGTNFPGVKDVPPLVIVGSEFTYLWVSGNAGVDHGWRFTYTPLLDPFLNLCDLPYAKLIESSHPCPIGYGSVEIDIMSCPAAFLCLHFHQTSALDVDNVVKTNEDEPRGDVVNIIMTERSWLEVYILDDHGEMEGSTQGSTIDDAVSNLKRVGERYFGSNLPGIGTTDDLLIPSKRFWIKYYIADNHASTGMSRPASSIKDRRLPWGFKAVAFPSEALTESSMVHSEHGNNDTLRIGSMSSITGIFDDILPLLSSTDTLTKEYCGGILCNLSYSSSADKLLHDNIRPNVFKVLEEMLKSERSWSQMIASKIISNLAALTTKTSTESGGLSIDQMLLESGLMGSLLSMWCHSDSFTRERTTEDISCVLSAISKTNSTSNGSSFDDENDFIMNALFGMLGSIIEKSQKRAKIESLAARASVDINFRSNHNTTIVASGPDITDISSPQLKPQNLEHMSSMADERLMRVIAESLAAMTDLDESISSGLTMSPKYLKDFLRFLKTPFPKVRSSLLRAIKNIVNNQDSMQYLSNSDVNEHLHFIFEILLDVNNIELQNLAAVVIRTILTFNKQSLSGKIVQSRFYQQSSNTYLYRNHDSFQYSSESYIPPVQINTSFDEEQGLLMADASWISSLSIDKSMDVTFQQLLRGKVTISHTKQTCIKGFVHPDIIRAGALSICFKVYLLPREEYSDTAGTLLYFGGLDSRVVVRVAESGCAELVVPIASVDIVDSNIDTIPIDYLVVTGVTRLRAGAWTNLAATIEDTIGGTVKIYLNGTVDKEVKLTAATNISKTLDGPWYIGPSILKGIKSGNGILENIKLFPMVLNQVQIEDIFEILPLQLYKMSFFYLEAKNHLNNMMSALQKIDFKTELNDCQVNNCNEKSPSLQSAFILFSIMILVCEDSDCATSFVLGKNGDTKNVNCLLDIIQCWIQRVKYTLESGQRDSKTSVTTVILESDHPYTSNQSQMIVLDDMTSEASSNTTGIKVWFDGKTSTLRDMDVLEFFSDQAATVSIAGPFSGDGCRDWPSAKSPLFLPLSGAWVAFKSGFRQVDNWGWKLYALPAEDPYLQRCEKLVGAVTKRSDGFPYSKYAANIGYEMIISDPQEASISNEIALLHKATNLLHIIGEKSTDKRSFTEILLEDNGRGFRMFVNLLELVVSDSILVEHINGVLYELVSDVNLLGLIVERLTVDSSTSLFSKTMTMRWLTSMVAMLSSEADWLKEVFYTDLAKVYDSESRWDAFDVEGGRVTISLTSKDSSNSSSSILPCEYILDITPTFDITLDGISNIRPIIDGCGLQLIISALNFTDELTQLMASRALANFMFIEKSSIRRRKVINDYLPVLLNKMKDVIDPKTIHFALTNSSALDFNIIAQNVVLQTGMNGKKSGTSFYYEVTVISNAPKLRVGFTFASIMSVGLSGDGFGSITPSNCYFLDTSDLTLRCGSDYTKVDNVDLKRINDGDVIGILLHLKHFDIQFTVNGKSISKLSASFDANGLTRELPSQWNNIGLVPAAFIPKDKSKVKFNFGHEPFVYKPSTTAVSVLEGCRGKPCPLEEGLVLNK
eukprot:gene8638-17820_t